VNRVGNRTAGAGAEVTKPAALETVQVSASRGPSEGDAPAPKPGRAGTTVHPGYDARHQEVAILRLLLKLSGRSNATISFGPKEPCRHGALVPAWENVPDMGVEDKISSFSCVGYQQSFTTAEGHALRESEAARLRAHART
jgi:hypothetical protein